MKYYYKTPDQVRKDAGSKFEREKHPLRNRTFLMILADVAIVLIIGGILYQSGALDGYLTAQGKLALEPVKYDLKSGVLKVKVTNTGKVRTDFPGEDIEIYEALWENLSTERLYRVSEKPANQKLEPEQSVQIDLRAPEELARSIRKANGSQSIFLEIRFEKQIRELRFQTIDR